MHMTDMKKRVWRLFHPESITNFAISTERYMFNSLQELKDMPICPTAIQCVICTQSSSQSICMCFRAVGFDGILKIWKTFVLKKTG